MRASQAYTGSEATAREKVQRHVTDRIVEYDDGRWQLLAMLRGRARAVQRSLGMDSLVYGSVARGDVHPASDVDIHLLDMAPSYEVELALDEAYHVIERRLTIASPGSLPKANVTLSDGTHVSWPLLPPREREEDFYGFGGAIDTRRSGPRDRVAGVSKRLLMVEPIPEGHRETSVIGSEVEVARRLDVPLEVVTERVRVLERRDSIGRTGIFRSLPVKEGETFEQLLETLAATTPAVRRQRRYRGGR